MRWVTDVIDALCADNAAAGLDAINQAVDSGADARQFARQIVEQLRALMLIRLGDPGLVDLPTEQRAIFSAQAEQLELDRLTRAIKLFNQAALDLRGGWQPQLPLELALVESLQAPPPSLGNGSAPAAPRRSASSPVQAQPMPVKEPEPQPAKLQNQPKSKTPETTAQDPVLTASPTATSPTATSPLTIEQVMAQWDDMLSSIKTRSIPTEALLRYCHVTTIEHNAVVVSWPNDSMKNRFEGSKHQRLLEEILGHTFEQKLHVRSVVEDPMLQTALKLGAKVTPVNR